MKEAPMRRTLIAALVSVGLLAGTAGTAMAHPYGFAPGAAYQSAAWGRGWHERMEHARGWFRRPFFHPGYYGRPRYTVPPQAYAPYYQPSWQWDPVMGQWVWR